MRKFLILLLTLAGVGLVRASEEPLDRLGDALTFFNRDKTLRGKLSGSLDLEAYVIAQPNPGLIYTDSHFLINPRLALFLDVRWGPHLYAFVQTRADRGFDPNGDTPRFRWDEYALRYAPGDDRTLVFEVGKFATVLGNWVPRHRSWDNAFISAPLPYENLTAISGDAAPQGAAEFVAPRGEEKGEYDPLVWGPSYASGGAVQGTVGRFDYAIEAKNAALTSAPDAWPIGRRNFASPTYTGRIAFRPDMRWCFGLSASDGAYFDAGAASSLPLGRRPLDYRQLLIAQDMSFAWHKLQLWAEIFECSFDVPRLGRAYTWSGYLESKYKVTPQAYVALRLNRQEFGTMKNSGQTWRWGDDVSRVDCAFGYKLTAHSQVKIELSWDRRDSLPDQCNAAFQFTVRL